MGKRSRLKGNRFEREIVNLHRLMGIEAKRVPMSGAAEGFPGDVYLEVEGRLLRCECKSRRNGEGFKVISRWLAGNNVLFLRQDRCEPMVVLPWSEWERLLEAEKT